MEGKVRLTVRGRQRLNEADDPAFTELVTAGSMRDKDGVRYIFYDELQEDDTRMRCRLKLSPGRLHIRRDGPGGEDGPRQAMRQAGPDHAFFGDCRPQRASDGFRDSAAADSDAR